MKVNDYVKTKDGLIHKITDIFNTTKQVATDKGKYVYEYNEIVKSSPNIIDLIEVGDIIKYHQVQNNYIKTNILYKAIKNEREKIELEYDITHNKKSIISILTKEQFERCEYKI